MTNRFTSGKDGTSLNVCLLKPQRNVSIETLAPVWAEDHVGGQRSQEQRGVCEGQWLFNILERSGTCCVLFN